jgi:xanthine dehydrogenase accessory factor
MNRRLLQESLELLDARVPHAIATIAVAKGSVPGKQGASMIVTAAGECFGTVGGAGLEEKTKALCRQAIAERKGGIVHFDLAYYKEGALDSLCGGQVDVFIEYMAPAPHVLIAGGGHCGLEVAKLCDQLEYAYSVVDERPDYASKERFPTAKTLAVGKPEALFPTMDLSGYTHLILVGHSHQTDTGTLYEAVKRFKGYIGLISSRMKKKEMFMRLKARGVTDEELARVEAPIGMAIGAETPAEIAVSILGSIIKWHKEHVAGAKPAAAEANVEEKA